MKNDLRCISGTLWCHDPQHDNPDLEINIGTCPDCCGNGCGDDGEPVPKVSRVALWLWAERQGE
jgi:hypothetical protein